MVRTCIILSSDYSLLAATIPCWQECIYLLACPFLDGRRHLPVGSVHSPMAGVISLLACVNSLSAMSC